GLLFALPAGILSSRFNQKFFLLSNNFFFILSTAASVVLASEYGILISTFVSGIVSTFAAIVSGPLIMSNTTEEERTYAFSFQYAIGLAGGALGSFSSGYFSEFATKYGYTLTEGYRLTIIGGCLTAAVGLLPLLLLKIQPTHPEDKMSMSITSLRSIDWKFCLKLLSSRALIGLGAGLTIPFLNLYFRYVHNSQPSRIGIYWSLSSITMLLGTLLAPLLSDRLGKVNLVVSSQLLSILFMLGLAFAPSESIALIPFLIRVALMNMSSPIANAFALESVPRKEQGVMNALLMLSWSLPWSLSTLIGGKMIERYGFYPSFISTSILYLLSSILFHLFFHNTEKERKISTPIPPPQPPSPQRFSRW
ncbi:MAG: MFS transporter, partial [Planctomycetota bacterium]|nr:MFS transporter [Planctomycetota bacterium]